MSGRVIVVGSVNIDLVIDAPRLPSPGETVTGGAFARHHGGKGGNQAVAAARLGSTTAFVGAVGDDDFGAEARAALAAEGIDVAELATLPGAATGVALILVGGGENLIAVASGANAALTTADVEASLGRLAPGAADVVLVGHEVPTRVARAALHAARAAGSTTVFNPAPAAGLDRATLSNADVLTPNRGELAALTAAEAARIGRRPDTASTGLLDAARTLVQPSAEGPGVGAVLVSLGAAGAALIRPDGPTFEIPAPRVAVVDTTGAGDTLNGALAAGLAAGFALEVAARRAVLAASLSTTRPGARTGMPTVEELRRASG